MKREKLGRLQLICLVAIANGYECYDQNDKVCQALGKKRLITFNAKIGWVLTLSGIEWLATERSVVKIHSVQYYIEPKRTVTKRLQKS